MELVGTTRKPIELADIRVRLIAPQERLRWDALMQAHHYLGGGRLVGKSLRYVAEAQGEWLALMGWAGAALKCAPRDRWIGWSKALQWQRVRFIVNNSRFLILPGVRVANLASRILSANLKRLCADWQRIHGHAPLLAETFIDPSRFAGTCYRAANWIDLGETRGFAKSNASYVAHGQSKRILVYPLCPKARAMLSTPLSDPPLPTTAVNTLRLSQADAHSLLERLARLPDPRFRRGRRHSQRSVLAVAVCAVVSGARGASAIAEWASRASPALLARLRCRIDPASRRVIAPSVSTIQRVLRRLDVAALEGVLGDWLQTRLPPAHLPAVAVDGKTLRGARQDAHSVHLMAALAHPSGAVLAQCKVAENSNEISAVKPLLDSLPLQGHVLTADALHTQSETARYLVEDKSAHYLFSVKDNQPTLKQDIASLNLNAVPPSVQHNGEGPRAHRDAPHLDQRGAQRLP